MVSLAHHRFNNTRLNADGCRKSPVVHSNGYIMRRWEPQDLNTSTLYIMGMQHKISCEKLYVTNTISNNNFYVIILFAMLTYYKTSFNKPFGSWLECKPVSKALTDGLTNAVSLGRNYLFVQTKRDRMCI